MQKTFSGSHVLIKCAKNKKPPEPVLQRAAALAAYYSKNRNQNLATVTYTFRKYVRKIKGAEKGKVSVSQEETILVKPSLN
jgi:predicted ribosome quality control (RQC) complex YloA/Tae2 family protein